MKVVEHVLERVLGQPRVEEHGDEHVPQWGMENCHHKWHCGHHLQQELPGHYLLTYISLHKANNFHQLIKYNKGTPDVV